MESNSACNVLVNSW